MWISEAERPSCVSGMEAGREVVMEGYMVRMGKWWFFEVLDSGEVERERCGRLWCHLVPF